MDIYEIFIMEENDCDDHMNDGRKIYLRYDHMNDGHIDDHMNDGQQFIYVMII